MKGRFQRMLLPLFFVGGCSFPEYAFKATDGSTPDARNASTCGDKVQGPSETGVDCGGVCPVCGAGEGCDIAADCDSANCVANICREATCADGIANGAESDVDCGGRCLKLCDAGLRCNIAADCDSGNCSAGRCLAPSCTDGISNGDETGVDCGGSCAACGIGSACRKPADCSSQNCDATQLLCVDAGCQDKLKNGEETDVDCGGKTCAPCAATQACVLNSDCDSVICSSNQCAPASCSDAVVNQGETDVDCGGTKCPACVVDRQCKVAMDCQSGVCQSKLCVPAMATGVQLVQNEWHVSASSTFSDSTTTALIDGDPNTRWTSGMDQAPGMWIELDLGRTEIFFTIKIDSAQFSNDAARSYNVYFSTTGTFGAATRMGIPGAALSTVTFDTAQVARYIKLELASNANNWWSVGEISIYQ